MSFVRNKGCLVENTFYKLELIQIHDLSTYRVFIKYCVIFEDVKIYSRLWNLSRFPLGVSVCTQWQVKHQS